MFAVFVAGVSQSFFVLFEGVVFEEVAATFARDGLAVFPVFGIDDFFDAGKQDGVKVVSHFNEQIFSVAAVFPVQVNDGMGGSTGTGEIVKNHVTGVIRCSS